MQVNPYKEIERMKNPDKMFDLVLAGAYLRGQLGGKMPVDESRLVFEKIKKLLCSEKN